MKKTIYVPLKGAILPVLVSRRKFLLSVFLVMLTCFNINSNAQNTKLVEGAPNTRFGEGALPNNNGSDNTAIGYFVMNHNTTGHHNTGTGAYSMANNTTGYFNPDCS